MTIRKWLGTCAAAVVLISPGALAAQGSPEEVAQAYFGHFRAGEMDRVGALTHPRALESFRTFMLGMIGDADLGDSPFAEMGDPETMPADSFFLAFLEGAGEQQEFGELFSTLEVQPLGHVLQGDSLAHVVYAARMAFMNQQAQQTLVLSLRRHRGAWLVDPGDGLMNMVGGGLMTLVMTAGMQAGITGADLDMDDDHDHGGDDDSGDDDDDDDDDDGDDDDDDDPPAS